MSIDEIETPTPEVMLAFYRRLYPFKSIVAWLNHQHAPTRLLTHREFAFTLQGDVYLRYNSFSTADDFKKQVCALNPTRFEIGPVYTARPRDKKTVRPSTFSPVQRELVFDIDLTDYDTIRTCCSSAAICTKCWGYITAAVRVLDNALRDQFGFQHLLWVYSGRRGIHLWVSDKEAMDLTDEQRKAIVGWLVVVQGGKEQHKKVNVRMGSKPLPPGIKTALDSLVPYFTQLTLESQDLFSTPEGWDTLLHLIPDQSIANSLRNEWSSDPNRASQDKWDDLKRKVKQSKGTPQYAQMKSALEDIVLQHTYPRLDAEVSKHRNHLLKAPFCIHPKTGRVCVPVDPETVDDFDPEKVPTVGQLLRELDEAAKQGEDGEHHSDWERTSLKPYVDMLDRHAAALIEEVRRVKRVADTTW